VLAYARPAPYRNPEGLATFQHYALGAGDPMTTTLTDIRRAIERTAQDVAPSADRRNAAVALLLTPTLDLLLMQRAERDGDPWSGHVSLPGGHVDPTDASLIAAAIRETEEEIGVLVREDQLLGRLHALDTLPNLPQLSIHPFVFAIEEPEQVRLNHEVQTLHRLSLPGFLQDEGRSTFEYDWRGTLVELPCVDFDGVRLWGLTLRIVDDLAQRLKSS